MKKASLFAVILALALLAAPAMATHPNFIPSVLVTDITAESNPGSSDARYPAYMLTNNYGPSYAGMYPPEWGGEGVGQAGSQTGYHYVWHPMGGTRGHWVNMSVPTENNPVVVEFDLRQIFNVTQISVWNLGSYLSTNWFLEGARMVEIQYKKAPWDAWSTFGTVQFAPCGRLGGTRPNDLYVAHNSNPWGTYRVTNALISNLPINTDPQPIRDGAIFEHFYYPAGQVNGKNANPIEVDFQARYVRFAIKSNWGDPARVGLGEVRFYKDGPGLFIDVDPVPAYSGSYVHPGNNLKFGDAYRNWTKPQNVIVYNLGTTAATVQGATVEGPFGLDTANMPLTLNAVQGATYAQTTLQALFSPTIIGAQTGAIHIDYDTAAGNFIETLNVSGTGKDVAFGYVPYVVADANQYGNPWWGGYEPKYAVNGEKTLYNSGGGYHMIEDMGNFVFGSKNAKEQKNNYETWRTQDYPQYAGVPTVEGVIFACDLGGALGGGMIIGNQTRDANQTAAVATHDISEIRIWNLTGLSTNSSGQAECMAAIRSVKFEYSSNTTAATWRDVTDWQQWGPDVFELEQPVPNIDSPATDILDVSDINQPIRWWRFTTLGLADGAAGANYGHANMVGLGQIRFYTSKTNVVVQPAGHSFGHVDPYESVESPATMVQNVGNQTVELTDIHWSGDPGPFSVSGLPTGLPMDLATGAKVENIKVTFRPILYGNYTANLVFLITDNTDPEEPIENEAHMTYSGSCNRIENGFIPVSHAWASSSWDGNWSPQWTYDVTGRGVREEPVGLWGSRAMKHWSNAGDRFLWHARQPGMTEFASHWVAWDFGSSKTLYDMLFWNAARTCCNGSARGFRKVKIQYTTDAPPTVNGGSEWGPWGGQSVPMEYSIAWDGLNWLELPATTMAIYPMVGTDMNNDGSFTTPDGWYAASNQVGGAPIQFQGRQARLVRIVADGPTWRDYYRSGNQDVWFAGGQDNYYNMAEARFYGPTSNAVYDVTAHDFGSVPVDGSASFDVTVTNLQSATAPLVIEGLFVEDRSGNDAPSPYSFEAASLPMNLAPGASHTFTVNFEPGTAGDYNTFEAVILNNSPRNGLMQVALTGTAYEAGQPDILLPATSVNFGQRFLQLGTQRVPFTIKNMGDTDLTVNFAFDPGNVFGTTQQGALTVPAFGSSDIWLTVTPQALGAATGVMTLTTNDGDEGSVEVPLTVNVANAAAASVDGSWMLYE